MHAAIHNVEAPFPQAFASRPAKKARSLFPGAPGYSRNRVPSVGRDRRPLGVHAPSDEVLRWSLSLLLGKHGRGFTPSPSLGNPYTLQLTRC